MNVRVQCLFRARRSLALLAKRCIATETPSGQPQHVPESYPRPLTEFQRKIPKLLNDEALKIHNAEGQQDASQVASSLHPSLRDGYEAGGPIKQGKKLDVHDENHMPMWGPWGIPIAFLSRSRPYNTIFPNFWLRDNCRCSKCVNQDTMQRAFDTFSIPHDVMPKTVVTEKEGLRVTWEYEDHISLYPWEWLQKHKPKTSLNDDSDTDKLQDKDAYKYWGPEIAENPPSMHYDEIMADDKGVGKWTDKIIQYGFSYVDGCPVSPEKTQELLERIAFIRITHYGGFYDFTSDLTMKDTAYTSLALGAHTDTTYFTDPAGLQMFHLLSHTDGGGGKSLLVDGFNVARKLRETSGVAYEILSKTPVPWHASGNEGVTITPAKKFPVLSFADHFTEDTNPILSQVRWNNDDRGVVGLGERDGMSAEKWYVAARLWSDILNRDNLQYWAQLEPGRPLIFDNWRVLHGRSSFTGKRRICGGYINHDDFISRWRNTNFTRKEVLKQIL